MAHAALLRLHWTQLIIVFRKTANVLCVGRVLSGIESYRMVFVFVKKNFVVGNTEILTAQDVLIGS